MYFRHNVDDTIEINGVKFDYDVFLEVEPNYVKPAGMSWRHYEQGATHQIHTIDGSQIAGEFPWEDGDRYISRLGDLKVMRAEHENEKQTVESVIKEIEVESATDDITVRSWEKIDALWEHIVMKKPKSETIEPLLERINKQEQPKKVVEDEIEDYL
jgi:hypothetical protein|tara:strand:- start:649 stop:1119 length:471 start_codon:yes stop_codon:yes gene_type:complete